MVSIIIRTYNEEKWIGKCLESVFLQDVDDNIEVVVVDSGSTDKTLEIVGSFAGVTVIHIPEEDFTFGYSLNLAMERCNGEYVAMLSAHAIPTDSKWLHNLIRNFKNDRVAGVYGKQLPNTDCNPLDRKDLSNLYGNTWKEQEKSCIFSNANAAVRKTIWENVRFDEYLSGSEDRYWASRVQKIGHTIIYEPSAAVYHSHNENLKQRYKRSYREMLGLRERFGLRPIILALVGTPMLIIQDMVYICQNRVHVKWIPLSFAMRGAGFFGAVRSFL